MSRFSKDFLVNQKKLLSRVFINIKIRKGLLTNFCLVMSLRIPDINKKILVPILEKILNKIIIGTYGICEHCGQDIEIVRLILVPAAEKCLKCAGCKKKGNTQLC